MTDSLQKKALCIEVCRDSHGRYWVHPNEAKKLLKLESDSCENVEIIKMEAVRDIAKEIQDRINEGKEVLLITKKHRESEEMYKETQARLEELYWAKELLVGSSKEDS